MMRSGRTTHRIGAIVCAIIIAAGSVAVGLPDHASASYASQSSAIAGVHIIPAGPQASLGPLINIPQTWNNCGPASVAEVLSYWGIQRTQSQVQAVLRADGNTHGMAPFGVPGYMHQLGMQVLMGVAGTPLLIKALVSNGFPVIVSQLVSSSFRVGHYRPIEAYSDQRGVFVSSDPYLGPDHEISYSEFAAIWAIQNHRFMVIYPPAWQAKLSAILISTGWNKTVAYQNDLRVQEKRLRTAPRDQQVQLGWGSGRHGSGYLNIAWDELELGQFAAARQALQKASTQGANPITIGWINQNLPNS